MLDINNRQSKPNAKHVLGVQEFHFFFFLEPPSGGFFENPPQENFPKAHGIFGWHDSCQKFRGTTIFFSLSLLVFYLHTLAMFVFVSILCLCHVGHRNIRLTRFLPEVEWRGNYEEFAVKTFISCQIWPLREEEGGFDHHNAYQGDKK